MATSIGVKLKMDGESEFRKGLNNIVSSTKNLDKQLDLLEKSFSDEKKSMEQNEKQTQLLERKKEQLEKQIQETNKALEYAKENYSANSAEVTSWEASLAQAEAQLDATNEQIAECKGYTEESTNAFEGQTDAVEESVGAYEELTNTISEQEQELETLRDAYIDAVLEFGEGSDEANALAGEISSLNSELGENKDRLAEATSSADGLTTSLGEARQEEDIVGDGASAMSGMFGNAIGGMLQAVQQGGLVGAIVAVGAALVEVGEKVVELQDTFDSGMSAIQIATGMCEDELRDYTEAAREASNAIVGMDMQSASEAVGSLSTRLHLASDDSEYAAEKVGEFYKTLGVDTTSAVNNAVDVMYQWGMVTGDSATDTQTLVDMLDMLVVAQQNAPVSVEELTSTLSTQAVAYQSLGLTMEDAVSMIDSYVNHGGNLNDISTASYNIFKNLNGEVDDLPTAFQEIIGTVSDSTDSFATMNEEIGDTGKTLEDILGAKKAGAFINTFSVAGATTDEFTESLHDTSGALDEVYEGSITESEAIDYFLTKSWINAIDAQSDLKAGTTDLQKVADKYNLSLQVGTNVGEGWSKTVNKLTNGVASLTDETTGTTYEFDSMGELIGVTVNGVEQDVRAMKKQLSSDFDSIGDSTDDLEDSFDSTGDAITDATKKAQDMETKTASSFSAIAQNAKTMDTKVSNALGSIESSASSMQSQLSNPIRLNVSAPYVGYYSVGSGSDTTLIPYSYGRQEFARAYDEAMILNAPTIFGASGTDLLVGGDRAGAEVVVGETHLLNMFERTIKNAMRGNRGSTTINVVVNGEEGQNINDLAQRVAEEIQIMIEREEAVYG